MESMSRGINYAIFAAFGAGAFACGISVLFRSKKRLGPLEKGALFVVSMTMLVFALYVCLPNFFSEFPLISPEYVMVYMMLMAVNWGFACIILWICRPGDSQKI